MLTANFSEAQKRAKVRRSEMTQENVALQFVVRRIKTSPYYEVDFSKIPDNPVEFVALLNIVKMTCEKTINDFANETGFSTAIKK